MWRTKLASLAVLPLVLCLVACGGGETDQKQDSYPRASTPPPHRSEVAPPATRTRGQLVEQKDFGDAWPFTVSRGYVDCVPVQAAVFRTGGKTYAINGLARSKYPKVDPIWRPNPQIPGTKVNIGPMISLALKQCERHSRLPREFLRRLPRRSSMTAGHRRVRVDLPRFGG